MRRYTAWTKLLGLIIVALMLFVVGFTCYMTFETQSLENLNYLITGIFGSLATYTVFYLQMAKAEHIEDKRMQLKQDLQKMENLDKIEVIKEQLEDLDEELQTVEEESIG